MAECEVCGTKIKEGERFCEVCRPSESLGTIAEDNKVDDVIENKEEAETPKMPGIEIKKDGEGIEVEKDDLDEDDDGKEAVNPFDKDFEDSSEEDS